MKDVYVLLGIAGCGALGAVSRYVISAWVNQVAPSAVPLGTLVVNVAGCFLIGALMMWESLSETMSANVRLVVTAGFLGALTTFSTFGQETLTAWQKSGLTSALLNIGANVCLGILAVSAGAALAKFLLADG